MKVKSHRLNEAASESVAHLMRDRGPDRGFWMHVDADALDELTSCAVHVRTRVGILQILDVL